MFGGILFHTEKYALLMLYRLSVAFISCGNRGECAVSMGLCNRFYVFKFCRVLVCLLLDCRSNWTTFCSRPSF